MVVGLAMVSMAPRARADESHPPETPRVRVTSTAVPSGRLVGTLVGLDEKTLTLRPQKEGANVRLERASIAGLEVSRRQGNRRKAIVLGLLVGAVVGAAVGAATEEDCQPGAFVCLEGVQTGSYAALGLAAGALGGLALSHGEKWETTTPDRLLVAIAPTKGGAAIRVSFGF